jgi:hypothetical protein
VDLHLAELKKQTEQNQKIIEQNELIIQLLSKGSEKPIKRGGKTNV